MYYRRQGGRGFHGAFTLVELMVVVLIIGLLAGLVGRQVVVRIEQAKVTKAKADIKEFEQAILDYKLDTGQYPDNQMGLQALVEQPPGVKGWNKDGYLMNRSSIPLDPWGNEYLYQYPGEYAKFDIWSYGPDGEDGTDDDIYNSDVERVSHEAEP